MIIIVTMFIIVRIGWPCSLPYVNLTSLALLVILPEQGLYHQKHCFLNNYCQNWGLYWLIQPASSDFIQMISALGLNISGWLMFLVIFLGGQTPCSSIKRVKMILWLKNLVTKWLQVVRSGLPCQIFQIVYSSHRRWFSWTASSYCTLLSML